MCFFHMNRLKTNEVQFVNVHPEMAQAALESGQVDAVAVWEPFAYKAKKALGEAVVEVPHNNA